MASRSPNEQEARATWSYPNIHGDVSATCDSAGVKQGTTFTYDPYGNALAGLPDNSDGNVDTGWTGQRPLEHEASLLPIIEMGARPYSPTLGRFLQQDPVLGGNSADYSYSNDPVSGQDYSGRCEWCAALDTGWLPLLLAYLDNLAGGDWFRNPGTSTDFQRGMNEFHGNLKRFKAAAAANENVTGMIKQIADKRRDFFGALLEGAAIAAVTTWSGIKAVGQCAATIVNPTGKGGAFFDVGAGASKTGFSLVEAAAASGDAVAFELGVIYGTGGLALLGYGAYEVISKC